MSDSKLLPADPVEAHAGGQPGERRARNRALLWLWTPTLAFIITRLGIALIALIAEPLLVDSSIPPYHLRPENVVLDVFGSRWDTGFYLSIAEEGYFYQGVELPSVAFFPLLPLLIRAVKFLTGDALLAGLIVTNLALWGAAALFFKLVAESLGAQIATRAVWFLLIFPTSFFGSAIYSESLFLLTAIGALYLFRKGYWESAGLLGVLGALSRLMGLLIAPLLLVEWWSQRRSRPPGDRPTWAALLAPLAVPLGTGAFMLYQQRTFGDPLAFVHASGAWE
ncbi:MAG: mannosyltransferase family protein, partial [Acidimicrobiia bacterium]